MLSIEWMKKWGICSIRIKSPRWRVASKRLFSGLLKLLAGNYFGKKTFTSSFSFKFLRHFWVFQEIPNVCRCSKGKLCLWSFLISFGQTSGNDVLTEATPPKLPNYVHLDKWNKFKMKIFQPNCKEFRGNVRTSYEVHNHRIQRECSDELWSS